MDRINANAAFTRCKKLPRSDMTCDIIFGTSGVVKLRGWNGREEASNKMSGTSDDVCASAGLRAGDWGRLTCSKYILRPIQNKTIVVSCVFVTKMNELLRTCP